MTSLVINNCYRQRRGESVRDKGGMTAVHGVMVFRYHMSVLRAHPNQWGLTGFGKFCFTVFPRRSFGILYFVKVVYLKAFLSRIEGVNWIPVTGLRHLPLTYI